MPRLNWKPIVETATQAAERNGHRLEIFEYGSPKRDIRLAMCQVCLGCCWVAHSPTRGFTAGGRLLKYRCGTKEAAGLL